MESRNEMSLQTLCQREGTTNLEKFDFVSKDGKKHLFFSLGSKKVIWASDRAQAALNEGMQALADNDVQKAKTCFMSIKYAECKKEGLPDTDAQGRSNWVPSLMINGNQPAATIQLTF